MENKMVNVMKKDNGFLLLSQIVWDDRQIPIPPREMVVEGKDPKKLGEAIIKMFEKPRGPRAKVSK